MRDATVQLTSLVLRYLLLHADDAAQTSRQVCVGLAIEHREACRALKALADIGAIKRTRFEQASRGRVFLYRAWKDFDEQFAHLISLDRLPDTDDDRDEDEH